MKNFSANDNFHMVFLDFDGLTLGWSDPCNIYTIWGAEELGITMTTFERDATSWYWYTRIYPI